VRRARALEVILLVGLLIVASLVFLSYSSANYTPLTDNEKYVVSPFLHKGVIVYEVDFHPTINKMVIQVLGALNGSKSLLLIVVILYHYSGVKTEYPMLISVKGATDLSKAYLIMINNTATVLSPNTAISIPSENFYVPFPFISPYLGVKDFINIDQRSYLSQNNLGAFVQATAVDFRQYSYRVTVQSEEGIGAAITQTYTWDKETGILIDYFSATSIPHIITLVSTTIIPTSPLQSYVVPLSLGAYLQDLQTTGMIIVALYFERWEIWAITFAVIGYFIFRSKISDYLEERKIIKAHADLTGALNAVYKQKKRVDYIEFK
jgi:hypothetical protein